MVSISLELKREQLAYLLQGLCNPRCIPDCLFFRIDWQGICGQSTCLMEAWPCTELNTVEHSQRTKKQNNGSGYPDIFQAPGRCTYCCYVFHVRYLLHRLIPIRTQLCHFLWSLHLSDPRF